MIVSVADISVSVITSYSIHYTKLYDFSEFAELWYQEKQVEWRTSQQETVRGVLDVHLLPYFGAMPVNHISKSEILAFRAKISQLEGRGKKQISASRVNHILTPLRMIRITSYNVCYTKLLRI